MRGAPLLALSLPLLACTRLSADPSGGVTAPMPPDDRVAKPAPGSPSLPSSPAITSSCDDGRSLTVHVYDVGQGLAALVDLPDGRHVLVDTGDSPDRRGCGPSCASANRHLLSALRRDLRGAPIDLLWVTHPHSDHVGGAASVLSSFDVLEYVDDGRETDRAEVKRARHAAGEAGVPIHVVSPDHAVVPLASRGDVRLTAVVPPAWPASCAHDANECSIALRVDDCRSSVLFTGDAEQEEEKLLDPGPVTLLQVAHHGSETSTSPAFLSRTSPHYAVISAGKPGVGLNRDYCHPRAAIVKRLDRVLGGSSAGTVDAFDGDRCDRATAADWTAVPASDHLWATERDGDVVLATRGDGVFTRVR